MKSIHVHFVLLAEPVAQYVSIMYSRLLTFYGSVWRTWCSRTVVVVPDMLSRPFKLAGWSHVFWLPWSHLVLLLLYDCKSFLSGDGWSCHQWEYSLLSDTSSKHCHYHFPFHLGCWLVMCVSQFLIAAGVGWIYLYRLLLCALSNTGWLLAGCFWYHDWQHFFTSTEFMCIHISTCCSFNSWLSSSYSSSTCAII